MPKQKFPKWIKAYRKKLKVALGLDAWEINVTCDDLGCNEFGQVIGTCRPHLLYLRAEIRLNLEHVKKPTTDAKITLIHEFLHVALARQKRVMQHWADDAIKKPYCDLLRYQYCDADEETIVRLSRALLPLIEAMPDA